MGNRNLIRFDWAIKRLLRNKADFSVLEGFLSELLKEDITIEDILESEGNQLSSIDKFNRVDILVRNAKGELVIIEIQNQQEYDYFHRMAYGTSKTLTEFIAVGEPYRNIKKIYSINIVYFDLGQGEDYVYHGKTDFIGIHKEDKLKLSSKQTALLGKTSPSEIFPEYYVIKVNQFNDIAKDTLDEWIYYFKNNEIKDNFTAKGIDKAKEIWRLDNLSAEEQKTYLKHIDNLHYTASMQWTMQVDAEERIRKQGIKQGIEKGLVQGIEQGIEKGIEQGAKQEKIIIAQGMLKDGLPKATIIKYTGLSQEEIDNL